MKTTKNDDDDSVSVLPLSHARVRRATRTRLNDARKNQVIHGVRVCVVCWLDVNINMLGMFTCMWARSGCGHASIT